MKKFSFFMVAAVLCSIAFTSCDNGSDIPEIDNSGIKGYLSVNITNPSALTYTEGPATNDPVESHDSNIKSLTLILVDQSDNTINKILPGVSVNAAMMSNPVAVSAGTFDVYALINNSSSQITSALVQGKHIQTVFDAVNVTAVEALTSTTNGFLMFNACNEVDSYGGVSCTIEPTNTASNPALATIKVDRLVAALRTTINKSVTNINADNKAENGNTLVSSVTVDGIYSINARANSNLIQQWKSGGGSKIMTMPATKAAFYNKATDIANWNSNNSIAVSSNIVPGDFSDLEYVLENRPEIIPSGDELTSYDNVTTGVIFKVTAKNTSNDAKTFYRVRQSGKYYYELVAAITALNTITGVVSGDVGYLDPDGTHVTADLRAAGIQVFENGAMYYTYWIKDQNYFYDTMKYHAVHRNAVYDLTINSISNIGTDVPGGDIDDPDNPNPITNTYIQVTITVNPWVLNNIGVDL